MESARSGQKMSTQCGQNKSVPGGENCPFVVVINFEIYKNNPQKSRNIACYYVFLE